ncbi:putative enoyl-CoA hydratase 1, peroxisomal [Anabarilius grahami]|uniref:Putative enoyl-CoA hydratase 1, peroxisomal n=1 Tax=Anabarilius grahami TaxID=495550 RepID=A0A3N0YY55_ANAGA|nr:putative enoyl-CoA hydratase 1, peroxisomal [Anabarilius grahami]
MVITEFPFLVFFRSSRGTGGTVVSERRGVVMVIGINRPEARNAVNQETAQRLTEELTAFDQDNSLLVAVLYGVGGNFCAGMDLKELAHDSSLKLEQDVRCNPGPMGPSRLRLSKPLIAAVSGYAVAGGLELALLADLRVVEESSIMGIFSRRFGCFLSSSVVVWCNSITPTPLCVQACIIGFVGTLMFCEYQYHQHELTQEDIKVQTQAHAYTDRSIHSVKHLR